MDEQKARLILADCIQDNDSLHSTSPWVSSNNGAPDGVELDGLFEIGELEAIVWWLRNKSPKHRA